MRLAAVEALVGQEWHCTDSLLNQSRSEKMPLSSMPVRGVSIWTPRLCGSLPQGPAARSEWHCSGCPWPCPLPRARRESCDGAGDAGWPWGTPGSARGRGDLRGVYLPGPAFGSPELYEAADAAASLRAAAIKLAGGSEVIPTALKWPKPVVCNGN